MSKIATHPPAAQTDSPIYIKFFTKAYQEVLFRATEAIFEFPPPSWVRGQKVITWPPPKMTQIFFPIFLNFLMGMGLYMS